MRNVLGEGHGRWNRVSLRGLRRGVECVLWMKAGCPDSTGHHVPWDSSHLENAQETLDESKMRHNAVIPWKSWEAEASKRLVPAAPAEPALETAVSAAESG